MKEPKAMREIHKIMEKIYEEEKYLTPEERVKRVHDESGKFLRDAGLKLKRSEKKILQKV